MCLCRKPLQYVNLDLETGVKTAAKLRAEHIYVFS